MVFKHLPVVFLVLLAAASLAGQETASLVSFSYQGVALGNALEDLQSRYDLRFTYSPSRLPMDYRLYATVEKTEVATAMDELFNATPVKHAIIGNQIVLRSDPGQLGQLDVRPVRLRQTPPLYQERVPRATPPATPGIPTREPRQLAGGDRWLSDKLEAEDLQRLSAEMERHERELKMEEYDATHRLAQISLLPYLGTNTHRSNEVTNNVSVNVFWGTSKAIEGFEIGGIANSVVADMSGLQIAGLLNQVGGNVTGTQLAGMSNYVAGTVNGVQLAGIGNKAKNRVVGAQVAGVFNSADYHVDGIQLAGLVNSANGDVHHQISSLYNQARYVSHRQVGLINVCDSTVKAPYGFLNFVKYGYNLLEVGSTEVMYVNLGAKLGTHRLYNILQLGVRWDLVEETLDQSTSSASYSSWALGYGLGFAARLGKKTLLNTEAVALHVNELEAWTNELNLLGQVRFTVDFQVSNRLSFYAGPTLNMMWSKLYDPVTATYGSRIPLNPLWNEQNGATNFQGWIGFSAGLRL